MSTPVEIRFTGNQNDLKRAVGQVKGEIASIKKSTASARVEMAKLNDTAGKLRGALGAGAVIAGQAALVAGIRDVVEYAGRVDDLAQRLDETPETIQRIGAAAKLSGTDLETVVRGLQRATQNAADARDGNKELAEQFEALGINAAEFVNLPTDQKLIELSRGLDRAGGSGDKLNTALDLLGNKAGGELVPLLKAGPDALAESLDGVNVIADENVQRLADLGDQLDLIGQDIKVNLGTVIADAYGNWQDFFHGVSGGLDALAKKESFASGFVSGMVDYQGEFERRMEERKRMRREIADRDRLNVGGGGGGGGGYARPAPSDFAKLPAEKALDDFKSNPASYNNGSLIDPARLRALQEQADRARERENRRQKQGFGGRGPRQRANPNNRPTANDLAQARGMHDGDVSDEGFGLDPNKPVNRPTAQDAADEMFGRKPKDDMAGAGTKPAQDDMAGDGAKPAGMGGGQDLGGRLDRIIELIGKNGGREGKSTIMENLGDISGKLPVRILKAGGK